MSRVILVALLFSAACAGAPKKEPAPPPTVVKRTEAPPAGWKAPEPKADGFDWLLLTSDEWLKGKITVMRENSLEFDSKELDDIKIEWTKVRELRSPKINTLLMADGTEIAGTFLVKGDQVVVRGKEESRSFPRLDIVGIAPGGTGRGYWSGKFTLGLTTRSGNTNQTEFNSYLLVRRRSAKSNLEASFRGYFGELDGESNVDNQRIVGRWDIFFGHRLFVTPFSLEVYRDTFQNISLRTTPGAGLGYQLLTKRLDKKATDWRVYVGGAYRVTEFDSGDTDRDSTVAVVLGTNVDWDITKNLEFILEYMAQVGVPDTEDTNQHLAATLSIDLWKDFDLDVSLIWDRVGKPRADSEDIVPERDDFRLTVGVAWAF